MSVVASGASLRVRLRSALTAAMKSRDLTAVSALRAALGAINNAETTDGLPTRPGPVIDESNTAEAASGLGPAATVRRDLSEPQVEDIVRAEVAHRRAASQELSNLGRTDHAEVLLAEANVLIAYLSEL